MNGYRLPISVNVMKYVSRQLPVGAFGPRRPYRDYLLLVQYCGIVCGAGGIFPNWHAEQVSREPRMHVAPE